METDVNPSSNWALCVVKRILEELHLRGEPVSVVHEVGSLSENVTGVNAIVGTKIH